jgi:hypothetical protein
VADAQERYGGVKILQSFCFFWHGMKFVTSNNYLGGGGGGRKNQWGIESYFDSRSINNCYPPYGKGGGNWWGNISSLVPRPYFLNLKGGSGAEARISVGDFEPSSYRECVINSSPRGGANGFSTLPDPPPHPCSVRGVVGPGMQATLWIFIASFELISACV